MMIQYFETLATGLEKKLAEAAKRSDEAHPLIARKKLALEVARLGTRLYSGQETVAWCGVSAPFDLLHALGVTSCFVEFVGAVMASTGSAQPQLETAEQHGYATDMCSYHRTVIGAALNGLMPAPNFLVATTCPCTAGQSTLENLARHFKKDLFVLNVPPRNDAEGVAYLAEQLRKLVDFVTAQTGRSLAPDHLREVMTLTNKTRAVMVEVFRLAQTVPSPARRRDLINFAFIVSLLLGSQSGLDLALAYRDEFTAKVQANLAGHPGERVRLLWFQNRIQFRQRLEEMLEAEYQAAVVVDELNDINWDPIDLEDPYTGLARRILSIPLNGTVQYRLENLKRLVRDYQVDGVICPCHWGCRQGTGASGLITTGLKEAGIPVLNLGVDCIDARTFAEAQLQTRLQAFVEMLLARKAA